MKLDENQGRNDDGYSKYVTEVNNAQNNCKMMQKNKPSMNNAIENLAGLNDNINI